ncbi:MAG: putative DNA binding domain-containing protein [Gracilibacteraceae bacterium]|nr:putative DNA binding domain-containing protein [Gracilibacteraceae bacterium]
MAMPINIKDLLERNKVESERIEYKANWNPEVVLHSICAFANDINNWGGGYILIGADERDGVPVLPPAGMTKASVNTVSKDLMRICNLLEPRYIPVFDAVTYKGKQIVILWVPGSNERPHSAPIRLQKKGEAKEKIQRAYYIRKASSTIRANPDETRELFEISSRIPFDDRPNHKAKPEDLRPAIIMDYLHRVESDLYEEAKTMHLTDLALRMRIAQGPSESVLPLNVGLLFFNERPDSFFRYARIEVVDKPDPTGIGMTEKYFYGPLDKQLSDAVGYLENYLIKAKTYKYRHSAEASRFYNYPLQAVEEALANAVHHRSYDSYEPIVVTITPEELAILSHPGPDYSISDRDISNFKMVSKSYRNRRIGEYLKELSLVEGRNTGIPRMLRALNENGSEPPLFETDAARSYFNVIFKIHAAFIVSHDDTINDTLNGAEKRITELMSNNRNITMKEMAEILECSRTTVSRIISEMKKSGKLKRAGSNKSGYWDIIG